jgi:RNA polymerase sigma-70 factor (ECF subfamily)
MSNSKSKYPNDHQQTMWLAQTINGNTPAFNNIIKRYEQAIYNLCYHMLKDADDAEDAAQEVFTRAYFKLDTYNNSRKFSTWLFSIAANYCIDQLRKRHFQLISWDSLATWHRFPGQESPQPERVLLETEASQEVRTLLMVLPPDYRLAVILKYWYAMSYQEIADTLKTTVSSVKSKLFRARKMMAASARPESRTNSGDSSRSKAVGDRRHSRDNAVGGKNRGAQTLAEYRLLPSY